MKNIIFKVEDPEDGAWYAERANDIIKHRGFNYLTTDANLHAMRRFVQDNRGPIDLKIRKGEIELRTRKYGKRTN